jgi:diacylglycerol O-acyltransferase / wax synthase
MYVIHGLENNRTAMLTKIHHAAVDGVSGVELLGTILDPTSEIREFAPPDEDKPPEPEPSDLQLAALGIGALPRQAARAARALPRTLRQMDHVPTMRNLPGAGTLSRAADQVYRALTRDKDGEILSHPAGKAPRITMGGSVTAHRRFAFTTLDLNTVKAIRAQVPGTTINDVLVALCSGAMRRRLLARADLPTDPLIAGVPISVRPPEGGEGNHISLMYVQMPTNEADVMTRLQKSHEVMKAAKTLHHAVPAPVMRRLHRRARRDGGGGGRVGVVVPPTGQGVGDHGHHSPRVRTGMLAGLITMATPTCPHVHPDSTVSISRTRTWLSSAAPAC